MGKKVLSALPSWILEVGLGDIENWVNAVMYNMQSLYYNFNVIYICTVFERRILTGL